VIEHGGGGSHAAAPVARDVLLEAQRRDSATAMPGKIADASEAAIAPEQPAKEGTAR